MGLLLRIPINRTSVVVVITDMKKRELDSSYWLTLQNRVLNHGFVTVTTNPETGEQKWKATPRGLKAYQTVLDLTKRKRLFNRMKRHRRPYGKGPNPLKSN